VLTIKHLILWSNAMAVIVNLQITLDPTKKEEAIAFIDRNLPDTRASEGCQWLYRTENPEDSNKLEFFSMWDSREHQERYLQWRQETGFMSEFEPYLAEAPVFRYLTVEKSY
jgi:quinol monooxygenase YgiN